MEKISISFGSTVTKNIDSILKTQYSYLSFDYDGRLLEEGDERQVRLAMDTLEPVIADKDRQVVDARHKFSRKRYDRECVRQPSFGIEVPIRKAILLI